MAQEHPGITVLIPSYNRSEVLRKSLEAMTLLDRDGVDCSIVIIDNNSTDNTGEIVAGFRDRLPITLLKEPRPGKNCALNKALRECSLKDIILFTDDDTSPAKDWFRQIIGATERHPGISVFGGRIELLWPDEQPPSWATAAWIQDFAFCCHHYANEEKLYRPPACPFGGNYWVRKSIFQMTPRFDESIGPRPTNRIMGSETSFLRDLQRQGLQMLYCPAATVHHRILAKECEIPALRRRGYTFGRGQTRIHGRHRQKLYLTSKALWAATILADYCYAAARFGLGSVHWNRRQRCELTVAAMIRFGRLSETFGRTWGDSNLEAPTACVPAPAANAALPPSPTNLASGAK
jgi:GT2 family glycosyltransferase